MNLSILQEDKKLMPSIKKLFYIVMSLKDERNLLVYTRTRLSFLKIL